MNRIVKAMLSGILVGLTGIEFLLVRTVNDGVLGQFLAAFFFPFGNLLICLLSFNLFNGKICLIFNKINQFKFWEFIVMLLVNIMFIVIVGLLFLPIIRIDSPIFIKASTIAYNKFSGSGFTYVLLRFVKGMGCGVFIALGNYFFRTFKKMPLKIIGLWLCIFTYVFFSLNNGLTDFFYLVSGGSVTIFKIMLCFIAVFGNMVGGILFQLLINLVYYLINKKKGQLN